MNTYSFHCQNSVSKNERSYVAIYVIYIHKYKIICRIVVTDMIDCKFDDRHSPSTGYKNSLTCEQTSLIRCPRKRCKISIIFKKIPIPSAGKTIRTKLLLIFRQRYSIDTN